MTLLQDPTGNSSLARTYAGWKWATPTPAAEAERAWREADPRHALPRGAELLARASQTILEIIRRPDASPQTRVAALRVHDLVSRLAFDGAPTPQISDSDDNGVEVVWLVAGQSVNADFFGAGCCTFWLTDGNGREIYAWDGEPNEGIPEPVVTAAREYLRRMSRDIRVPVGE